MRLRHLLAFALTAALLPAAVAAQPPTPLLWQVSSVTAPDRTVYLLGSFHMLKDSDYPLAASVHAAYADAEDVIFELDPIEAQSPELAGRMLTLGALPATEQLRDRLSASTWAEVQAYADNGGMLPLPAMERMQPWFLALTLAVLEMQKAGLNPQFGLDQHFMRQTAADGKPTAGLETMEAQLQFLSSGSRDEQDQQLRQTLEEIDGMRAELDQMHALWRGGDGDGLLVLTMRDLSRYPQLYRRLIVQRNLDWLPQIEKLMTDADDELVVVGALHLLGDDGVVALLQRRGYTVRRIGLGVGDVAPRNAAH